LVLEWQTVQPWQGEFSLSFRVDSLHFLSPR
jgi:hypothetical protein